MIMILPLPAFLDVSTIETVLTFSVYSYRECLLKLRHTYRFSLLTSMYISKPGVPLQHVDLGLTTAYSTTCALFWHP